MNIKEYLNDLGATADEVANNLRAAGIKGVIGSRCHCPIINGVYQACPTYWSGLTIICGRKTDKGWWYSAQLNDSQIIDPTLPQPVMDFIGEFDSGKYPDLQVAKVTEVITRVYG